MLILSLKREERGWSRAELARRARKTPSDIGKIEAGRLIPYPSQLRKIARALGISAAEANE
jgi:ribosome-binding protein aMBF1 (putative translation factor)